MRVITFRGVSLEKAEWVFGSFVRQGDRAFIIPDNQKLEYGGYIYIEVNPHTVGQFTGLKDKNGRMNYEGDILRRDNDFRNYLSTVGGDGKFFPFHGDALSCVAIIPTPARDYFPVKMPERICTEWEVIGNGFQNPDMLKEVSSEPRLDA